MAPPPTVQAEIDAGEFQLGRAQLLVHPDHRRVENDDVSVLEQQIAEPFAALRPSERNSRHPECAIRGPPQDQRGTVDFQCVKDWPQHEE